MAQQARLEVLPRTVVGKATNHLRRQGIIPANIYGHKEPPTMIQIDALVFDRLRREHATRSTLWTLALPEGTTQTAVVGHVQHHPVTGTILHVDFVRTGLREHLETKVPLHFVGDAPGVKLLGGTLIHLLEALTIECAVSDLVDAIEVDVTSLSALDDILYARDIKLPKRYKLVTDPDEPVVKVNPPRNVESVSTSTGGVASTPAMPAATGRTDEVRPTNQ